VAMELLPLTISHTVPQGLRITFLRDLSQYTQ
jgi:hypothetical protein